MDEKEELLNLRWKLVVRLLEIEYEEKHHKWINTLNMQLQEGVPIELLEANYRKNWSIT